MNEIEPDLIRFNEQLSEQIAAMIDAERHKPLIEALTIGRNSMMEQVQEIRVEQAVASAYRAYEVTSRQKETAQFFDVEERAKKMIKAQNEAEFKMLALRTSAFEKWLEALYG